MDESNALDIKLPWNEEPSVEFSRRNNIISNYVSLSGTVSRLANDESVSMETHT